ncbi:MAG: hypothetical protein ACRC46_03830 [Thermoguttaceae bacterium]
MKTLQVYCWFLCVAGAIWCAADVVSGAEMTLELDSASIYFGESISCRITISSDRPVAADAVPDWDTAADFSAAFLGRSDGETQSFRIVNGQRSGGSVYTAAFTYALAPLRTGPVTLAMPRGLVGETIPLSRVVVAGRTFDPKRNVVIEVQDADKQDFVRLTVTTDKPAYYPQQPIGVTLSMRVKPLSGSFADKNPLTIGHDEDLPHLTIPWCEAELLPRGLVPQESLDDLLAPLLTRSGGVSINNLRPGGLDLSTFGFGSPFMRQQRQGFLLPSHRTTENDAAGQPLSYWDYQLTRHFTADRVGKFPLGSVTVRGAFVVDDASAPQGVRLERLYAASPLVTVTVRDVPREGRPSDYIGAFGRFTFETDVQPRSARVGDPLTLTLTLRGEGSTAQVQPPSLDKIRGDLFRVYPPTEEVIADGCRFVATIRPLREGQIEFPSMTISTFDTTREEFVSATSAAIPLEIAAAGSGGGLRSFGGNNASQPASASQLVRPVETSDVRNDAVNLPRAIALIVAPPLILLTLTTVLWLVRRSDRDPVRRRRFRAHRTFAKRLSNAANAADIHAALAGLVADICNTSEQALSRSDIIALAKTIGLSDDVRSTIDDFLARLDAARFAGTTHISCDIATLRNEAASLAKSISISPTISSTSVPVTTLVFVVCLCLVAFGCSRVPSSEQLKNLAAAEAAWNSGDFRESARSDESAVANGLRSGDVFRRLGDARMQLGDAPRAVAAYRQALRYQPRDRSLRESLSAARETAPSLPPRATSTIFFWQDIIAYPEKFSLAAVLSLVASLLGAFAIFRSSRWGARCAVIVFGLAVLMTASAIDDWWTFDANLHGVVETSTTPRLGGAARYDRAMASDLDVGTEFVVTEERGDWLRVRLADGREVWIDKGDVVCY